MNENEVNMTAEETTTVFRVVFGGNFSRQIECLTCHNLFVERVEKPFDFCPYCGKRRER